MTPLIIDRDFLVGKDRETRMSAFSLKWPPDRYLAWLLNESAFVPFSCNHACDTGDIQNGEPVYLTNVAAGGSDVAFCELTYYYLWHNIRGVGRVSN